MPQQPPAAHALLTSSEVQCGHVTTLHARLDTVVLKYAVSEANATGREERDGLKKPLTIINTQMTGRCCAKLCADHYHLFSPAERRPGLL